MGFGSQVSEANLDGLQPQQAGLLRLSLNILERNQDLDAAAPCANLKVVLGCMHAEQKANCLQIAQHMWLKDFGSFS